MESQKGVPSMDNSFWRTPRLIERPIPPNPPLKTAQRRPMDCLRCWSIRNYCILMRHSLKRQAICESGNRLLNTNGSVEVTLLRKGWTLYMLLISETKSLTVVQLSDFYLLEQEKRPWSLNGRMTGAKFYHDLVCERNAMRSLTDSKWSEAHSFCREEQKTVYGWTEDRDCISSTARTFSLVTFETIMSHTIYLPWPTRIPLAYRSNQQYSFQSDRKERDTVLVGTLRCVYQLVSGRYE